MSQEFVIYKIDSFGGGIHITNNSYADGIAFKQNEAMTLINFILNKDGSISGRFGISSYDLITGAVFYFSKLMYRLNGQGVFYRYKKSSTMYDVWRSESSTDNIQNFAYADSDDYLPDAECYNNDIYIVSNNGNKKYVESASSAQNFGITAPSTNCSAATGAAGNLTGTYVYYYSFYNGTTGSESALSAVSASVSPSSHQVDLTSVDISTDSQVTARRIYRLGAGSDVIYYAGEIANNTATTFTDNTASLTTEQDCQYNYAPPVGSIICKHGNQLFIAGNSTYPRNLYFSRFFKPEAYPLTYYETFPADITGLVSVGIDLIVFTAEGTYRVRKTGLTEIDYIVEKMFSIGCQNKRSIQKISIGGNECCVFLTTGQQEKMIACIAGSQLICLSNKISAVFDITQVNNDYEIGAGFDLAKPYLAQQQRVSNSAAYDLSSVVHNNTYYILLFSYLSKIVYGFDLSNIADPKIFMLNYWQEGGTNFEGGYMQLGKTEYSDGCEFLMVSRGATFYYVPCGYIAPVYADDTSYNITKIFHTGYFGDRNIYGTLRSISFNADTGGAALTVKIYADYALAATLTCTTSSMSRVKLDCPNTCYGKLFSIRFESTSSVRTMISPPLELKVSPWRR